MQLVDPAVKYKESFLAALREYQQEKTSYHEDLNMLDAVTVEQNFQTYVNKFVDESKGKNLPPGYIPHTAYWLMDREEFIGRVDIRHTLTEQLLKIGGHIGYDIRPSKRRQGYGKKVLELALQKAKALGISLVLVTCDDTNIGSKKIIEANGGVLEKSTSQGPGKPRKLRYWITL